MNHQQPGLGATAVESQTAQELRASAAQAAANGNYAWSQQLTTWAARLESDPGAYPTYAPPPNPVYQIPRSYPYAYPLSYYSVFHPIDAIVPSLAPFGGSANVTVTTTSTRGGLFAR